jgi:hypothetical protein
MNCRLKTIYYHGENDLIADPERSDQKLQERAEFARRRGTDRNRIAVSGGGNLEPGVSGEKAADPFEIASDPRGIQIPQQSIDLNSGRHRSFCATARDTDQYSRRRDDVPVGHRVSRKVEKYRLAISVGPAESDRARRRDSHKSILSRSVTNL